MEKMKTTIVFVLKLQNKVAVKTANFVSQFSPWKMHQQKQQSTPWQRARKNKEDGSLHFFHRPPESGLILHRSCVIYDGSRPPEIVISSLFQFPWEMQNLWLRRAGAGQAPILSRMSKLDWRVTEERRRRKRGGIILCNGLIILENLQVYTLKFCEDLTGFGWDI